jgi:glycerol-3-phosphate acyltransferase PlsY
MNLLVLKIITAILSYLLGSFPTAFVLYKIKTGKDIRSEGSGNVGGTNVARTMGAGFGIMTVIVDILKAFIPITVVYFLFPGDLVLAAITAVVVVLGHDFPVYLKFRGGKGISSSYGVIFGLCAYPFAQDISLWLRVTPAIAILAAWLIIFAFSRMVSLASLGAAIATPLAFFFSKYPMPIVIASICLFILTFIAHKDNIKRLIKKEEKKITGKGA